MRISPLLFGIDVADGGADPLTIGLPPPAGYVYSRQPVAGSGIVPDRQFPVEPSLKVCPPGKRPLAARSGEHWPVSIPARANGWSRTDQTRSLRPDRGTPARPIADRPLHTWRRRRAASRAAPRPRFASIRPPCASQSAILAAFDGAQCGWSWAMGSRRIGLLIKIRLPDSPKIGESG
jgi:hypothetical protein